jgi:hypothetical protein
MCVIMNLIFREDFGWHSFTTEFLDYLQSESRSTLAGTDMGAYLKVTHQKKKWWMTRLKMCIAGCTNPTVVEFDEKVLLNLLSMHNEAYFTTRCSALESQSDFAIEWQ